MGNKRTVEIFSAGCSVCDEATDTVKRIAGDAEVIVRDMMQPDSVSRARELGVRSVPAIAVDGRLAECCSGRGPNEEKLIAALAE